MLQSVMLPSVTQTNGTIAKTISNTKLGVGWSKGVDAVGAAVVTRSSEAEVAQKFARDMELAAKGPLPTGQ